MSSTEKTPTRTLAPPPMDDESVSDPLECPPLRWGILGCGRVSHDFCQALKFLKTAEVVACAARDASSAQKFAATHGIGNSYGSYDELLSDESVEIVYVGNVHKFRRSVGEKCLRAGKHILLEKPFACSYDEAKFLVDLAREKGLFCMEGMWTNFFPAVERARCLVSSRQIGEPVSVHSSFCFNAADSEDYPSSFVYQHGLGGGSSFLVAPYPIAAATLFLGEPDVVKVTGQVDPATGVDLQGAMVLSYPPTSHLAPASDPSVEEMTPKLPGAAVATLSFGVLGEAIEETSVVCTQGRLRLCEPGHCPTRLVVTRKVAGVRGGSVSETFDFALPEDTPEIVEAGGWVYPNSAGFAYEAAAVARCIAAGKLETPQCPLDRTLIHCRLVDEIRSQLGVAEVNPARAKVE